MARFGSKCVHASACSWLALTMPCAVQQADVVFVGLQEVVALTPKGVMLPDEAKVYALYCLLLHRADRFQNGLDDGDQRSA